MYYSKDVVEEIREGNDIVNLISSYVDLKQKGSSYFGLCPFHNESTPSFSVSIEKQLYHCFGCGASGNVYSFIMQMENLDFPDAIKNLADRIHYSLPEENDLLKTNLVQNTKATIYKINIEAAKFFYNNLISNKGKKARDYLDARLISYKTRVKYGLGYSTEKWDMLYKHLMSMGYSLEDVLESGLIIKSKSGSLYDRFRDRLMFPIFDVSGKVIGFGGRTLSSTEPKYLNSPETIVFNKSKSLYSINFARKSRLKEVILVEGYMDVISLYQSGFYNVVAALGTSLTEEHSKLLYKYVDTVIIAFDNDEAGKSATLRSIPILIQNGVKVKVLQLKHAKDPDEYVKRFGKDAFSNCILESKSHIDFQIENIGKNYNLQKTEDKIEFTSQVAKLLSTTKSDIELDAYISQVSNVTGISQTAIRSEINKLSYKPIKVSNSSKNLSYHKVKDKGLYHAKKNIIYIASNNHGICEKIKKYLKPHEMGEEVYVKALNIIYDLQSKNNDIYPAQIVNYFNTIDDQKVISEIFLTHLDLNDRSFINQAVNDQIKVIKRNYIDEQIAKTDDVKMLQNLINTRRCIETLNISVLDG